MSPTAYAYYPGCSSHSTAREYDVSARLICRELGIELKELPDWTCCGASYAHLASHLLGVALPARNLALAADLDLPITTICAACFARLKTAALELTKPPIRQAIADVLERPVPEEMTVVPLVKVLADLENIPIRRPLTGLRVASYYGCLLVRPRAVADFDDPENPQMMDRLVERLGAIAVDWGLKVECCGAGLALPRPDVVEQLAYRILATAQRAGAHCIVTACPLCQNNLDMRQRAITARFGDRVGIPVLFITQLVGLAMALDPDDLMIDSLITDAGPVLEVIGATKVAV